MAAGRDGHGRRDIGEQIHQEQLARIERALAIDQTGSRVNPDLAQVPADQNADGVSYRGPHGPALDDGIHYRLDTFVGHHHVSRRTRRGRAALPDATPTSASRMAGASLAPSPTMATT